MALHRWRCIYMAPSIWRHICGVIYMAPYICIYIYILDAREQLKNALLVYMHIRQASGLGRVRSLAPCFPYCLWVHPLYPPWCTFGA